MIFKIDSFKNDFITLGRHTFFPIEEFNFQVYDENKE